MLYLSGHEFITTENLVVVSFQHGPANDNTWILHHGCGPDLTAHFVSNKISWGPKRSHNIVILSLEDCSLQQSGSIQHGYWQDSCPNSFSSMLGHCWNICSVLFHFQMKCLLDFIVLFGHTQFRTYPRAWQYSRCRIWMFPPILQLPPFQNFFLIF